MSTEIPTDPFDYRLHILNRGSGGVAVPTREIDAAIRVYERMKTARAACQSLFGDEPAIEAVLETFRAISDEVHLADPDPEHLHDDE